jgi:hypothetical protein
MTERVSPFVASSHRRIVDYVASVRGMCRPDCIRAARDGSNRYRLIDDAVGSAIIWAGKEDPRQ